MSHYPGTAATRRDPAAGVHLHGRWFDDPYAWMADVDAPETQAWLAAQESAARAVLDAVPGRAWLRDAVARATRHARRSAPIRTTTPGREFVWAADEGEDRPTLRMRRDADAPLEPVIDMRAWAPGAGLAFAVPSPDGTRVAVGVDPGVDSDAGDAAVARGVQLRVLDVASGRLLPDRPRGTRHGSVAWRPDGSGFFYTACPEPGEVPPQEAALWHAGYEHRLGAAAPARRVCGAEARREDWCTVEVSECGRFAVCTVWDFVHANTVSLLRLSDGAWLRVTPEMRGVHRVQVLDDVLLIHTDLDAPRGRACVAPLEAPAAWRTLIPEGEDTLQTVTGVAGRVYGVVSRAASHQVRVYEPDGTFVREVALPALGSVNWNEGAGVVSGVRGAWRGDEVWVHFASFVHPPSLYRYDAAADRLVPYHVPDVGLDPADFATEQVWYASSDGTQVSMFLVHRRDVPRDGGRPVRLSGYGGFNIAAEPRFTAAQAAWLALGGVLAFPNVRGGGEYGRAWHEAATRTRRQRAFDDYVAAARWLAAAGYTSPARIVSRGNSNGGLLVAVAAMQSPDAFGAVISRAAPLDMLRFPRFGALRAAVAEYGDPGDPAEAAYLAGYSPYQTVRSDRSYPPTLFVAALRDEQAPPDDPLRMTARLQSEAPAGGPYLLLPLHGAGHAGGPTTAARIEQDVDELSFACWALGVATPNAPAVAATAAAPVLGVPLGTTSHPVGPAGPHRTPRPRSPRR